MVYVNRTGENLTTYSIASPVMTKAVERNCYGSSIRFGNGKGGIGSKLTSCISAPFRFVAWIFSEMARILRNYLCCCCTYRDSDSIDWDETKDTFEVIYTAIFPSEHGNHATDRQKRFTKAFQELSNSAQEKFREHIGFVLAKRHSPPITERPKQIEWYKANRDKIRFNEDYFENISSNEVLKEAVKNFQKELEEKTK